MKTIKKREQILGIAFFISFIIGGIPLSNMLRRAWESKGVTWHLYYGAPIDPNILGLFFIGVFFGLVFLMMVDVYKRMVGVILLSAGMLAMIYLYLFQSRVQFDYLSGSFLFLIGAYLGMVIGGRMWRPKKFGELYEKITDSEEIPEYPGASLGLLILMLLVVGFALAEVHINYQSGIIASGGGGYGSQAWAINGVSTEGIAKNILFSSLFLFALAYVAQYERKKDVAIVGSKRAGKTTLAAGLGDYIGNNRFESLIDDQEKMPYQAAEVETGSISEQLYATGEDGGASIGEGTEANRLRTISLTYIKGKLFPYNISINSLDYSGEHINDIVNSDKPGQTQGEDDETSTDGGSRLGGSEILNSVRSKRLEKLLPDQGEVNIEPQEVRERLVKLFNYSDTLVIVLPFDLVHEYDMDDLPGWYEGVSDAYSYEKGMLGDYKRIVSNFNNKDIAVIVTKCDYLIYNEKIGFPEDSGAYMDRAPNINSGTTTASANSDTRVYTDGEGDDDGEGYEWQDKLSDKHHLIEKDDVYEEFITKVVDEMRNNSGGKRQDIQEILAAAGGDARVYPVYFQPNEDNPVEGEDINIVQDNGRANLVGAKQLLNRLGGE